MMPSTFNKVDYIMITVSNMARSVSFYKDKLGLPMKFGTPEWTEFQTGTTTLALHGGGTPKEAPRDPNVHFAGTCSIGFNVDNLDLVYEQLQAKGVVFVMPPTAREGEDIKLAVAMDPDGLAISFGEAAKK
jgi:lactoylglutathione lyase